MVLLTSTELKINSTIMSCIPELVGQSNYPIWSTRVLLHSTWVRASIDLVRSKVLPVIKIQVDVEGVSTWRSQAEIVQRFKGSERSTYSEVRRRLVEIWRRSQGDQLVLEVQGRLAWGKIERD